MQEPGNDAGVRERCRSKGPKNAETRLEFAPAGSYKRRSVTAPASTSVVSCSSLASA